MTVQGTYLSTVYTIAPQLKQAYNITPLVFHNFQEFE